MGASGLIYQGSITAMRSHLEGLDKEEVMCQLEGLRHPVFLLELFGGCSREQKDGKQYPVTAVLDAFPALLWSLTVIHHLFV